MQITNNSRNAGEDYQVTSTLTCDNNYLTGGYVLTPQNFGMSSSIDDVLPVIQSAVYVAEWVAATQSVRVSKDSGSGLVEVGNGSGELNGISIQLLVIGR